MNRSPTHPGRPLSHSLLRIYRERGSNPQNLSILSRAALPTCPSRFLSPIPSSPWRKLACHSSGVAGGSAGHGFTVIDEFSKRDLNSHRFYLHGSEPCASTDSAIREKGTWELPKFKAPCKVSPCLRAFQPGNPTREVLSSARRPSRLELDREAS